MHLVNVSRQKEACEVAVPRQTPVQPQVDPVGRASRGLSGSRQNRAADDLAGAAGRQDASLLNGHIQRDTEEAGRDSGRR